MTFALVALAVAQGPWGQPVKDHFPHSYDLLDVKWHVKLIPAKYAIEGEVTNTVKALSDNPTLLFDSVGLKIESASVDGVPAAKSLGSQTLLVAPRKRKIKKGEVVHVTIKYSGSPEAGIYFIPAERAYPAKTPVVYTQGEMVDTRYWIPTYDYPDDKATSEGIIEVPNGWNTLSNGRLVKTTVDKKTGYTAYDWKQEQPHSTYLISLLAGPFSEVADGTQPVKTSIFVPTGLESWGKAAFGGTDKIVQFYGDLTHFTYPWAKFAQCTVPDFMYGGMENTGAVTQTITAIFPPDARASNDATGLVAHELAHQWFGDTVTCPSWAHAWINEGWASFLPSFWERQRNGDDAFALARYGTFQGGLGASADTSRPVVWDGYREAVDMFNGFIYAGGASRMFMLMHQVGEDKFWPAVGQYLNECKFQNVDTPRFFDVFSKNLGVDLKPFMKQWFYTPSAPHLVVRRSEGKVVISQSEPNFDFDLDVWILADGWIKRKVHISGPETTLDLEGHNDAVALVDPECWVMANIDSLIPLSFEQAKALWVALPNDGARARVMDSMFNWMASPQWFEIAKLTQSDAILDRLIGHLGAEASGYLTSLLGNKNRALAKTALERLGELGLPGTSKEIARTMFESDPDSTIRQTAYRQLIKVTGDVALLKRGLHMDGVHDQFRIDSLRWYERQRPDEARTLCLQMLAHPDSEPERVTAIQTLGRLKDMPGKRTVFNALAAILNEKSFGARSAAINALGEYGDKAAVPLLTPFTRHAQVFFRNSARSIVERLSKK